MSVEVVVVPIAVVGSAEVIVIAWVVGFIVVMIVVVVWDSAEILVIAVVVGSVEVMVVTVVDSVEVV